VIVSLEYWEYPVEFMDFQPKTSSGGHSLILGRPTTNEFIGCRSRNMLISHGDSVKNVTMCPPTKYSHELEKTMWLKTTNSDEENIQTISIID